MMGDQASRQRVAVRRVLVSSAFTLAMLVVGVGLFSLFSVWSINRAWVDGTRDTARLQDLSREAVQAQVSFKVQVQEWKNILLRGDDARLLEQHLASFRARVGETRDHLRQVAAGARELGLTDRAGEVDGLRTAHDGITERYEAVLAEALAAKHGLTSEAARAIDKRLRGIDRELERDIGVLSGTLSELSRQRYQALTAQMDDRYAILRRFIIGVVVASLVVTGYVLAGALRSTRA